MPTYRILEKRILTDDCFVLRTERKDLKVLAGQCVNIGLPGNGVNREYSLYCGENDPYLEFLIREIQEGRVTPVLAKLNPGDTIEIDGPYGEFTLRKDDLSHPVTMIATGTGIAPFKCYTRTYPELDYRILHGVRDAADQYEKNSYSKGRYVGCVSQGNGGDYQGRVTHYLETHPEEIKPDRIYFICGNRNMISEVYDILIDGGVSGSNIRTEVFY